MHDGVSIAPMANGCPTRSNQHQGSAVDSWEVPGQGRFLPIELTNGSCAHHACTVAHLNYFFSAACARIQLSFNNDDGTDLENNCLASMVALHCAGTF